MSHISSAGTPYYVGRFILEGTVDTPVTGYTDGSRWNGWATPFFDHGTALQVMRAVNHTNSGEDDQIGIDFNADDDAFLIHDPNYPDEGPQAISGRDIEVDGRRVHVYALGTRNWTWVEAL